MLPPAAADYFHFRHAFIFDFSRHYALLLRFCHCQAAITPPFTLTPPLFTPAAADIAIAAPFRHFR